MSDLNTPTVPQEQVLPGQPAVIDKPLSQREQIYQNFYQSNPEAGVQQADPVVEPVAQVEPVVPQVQTPSELDNLKAELAALKAQITPPPAPAPVVQAKEQEDWLKLLSEGKKEEAEQALFQTKAGQELASRIQQEAVDRMVAERQMYEFNSQVRQANPEVLQFEEYITYGAQARIASALQAGKIRNPGDYVTVYKEAVNAEIEKARNITQSIRGAGKTEAQVRQQQVISSQTLQPNPVNQVREQQQQSQPPEPTLQDYFAERQKRSMAAHGLAVRA
jgi:hypothetical protein